MKSFCNLVLIHFIQYFKDNKNSSLSLFFLCILAQKQIKKIKITRLIKHAVPMNNQATNKLRAPNTPVSANLMYLLEPIEIESKLFLTSN